MFRWLAHSPAEGSASVWTLVRAAARFTLAPDVAILAGILVGGLLIVPTVDGQTPGKKRLIATGACTSCSPQSVIASDIDQDGDEDIVVASQFDDRIMFYRNDESGFTPIVVTDNATVARGVHADDVDGDGDTDLLAALNGRPGDDGGIVWYENDGQPESGSWPAHTIGTFSGMQSVSSADVDGDGDTDVLGASVSGSGGGSVVWFENDGTPKEGTWTTHDIATLDNANGVSTADFDQDGNTDVVAAGADVVAYENDGTPRDGGWKATIIDTESSKDVAAVDLDDDGQSDVLSASAEITWYEGDGSGNFPQRHQISSNTADNKSVFADDLDDDGDIDVLSAEDEEVHAFISNGADLPSFDERTVATMNGVEFKSVYAADVDGDNIADALSASSVNNLVAWYPGEGDGGFGEPTRIGEKITLNKPQDVDVTDLDSDGNVDVLVADWESGEQSRIEWFRNDGDPSNPDQGMWQGFTISLDLDRVREVHADDVDQDGDVDVLAASSGDDRITWYENDGTPTDGGWTSHIIVDESASFEGIFDVKSVDIDGDGDIDVVAADEAEGDVLWYRNDGTPRDGEWVEYAISANTNPTGIAIGDLDGDGDPDVVEGGSTNEGFTVEWFENQTDDGVSTTDTWNSFSLEAEGPVRTANINGDDNLDIVSLCEQDYTATLCWLENNGNPDPLFFSHLISSGVRTPVPANLTGPEDQSDIIALGNELRWFNRTGSGFEERKIDEYENDATDAASGDIDGDGDNDVVVGSDSTGDGGVEIAWYENVNGGLPVELVNFTAQARGRSVLLSWSTVSETKNAGFYVQHQSASTQGDSTEDAEMAWRRLGFVAGAGTTSEPESYKFSVDQTLALGTNQFRLRQVDADGTAQFSEVVSVDLRLQDPLHLSAPAPNPAVEAASFSFAVKQRLQTTIALYNVLGQKVATIYKDAPDPNQVQTVHLSTTDLPSGAYFLRLQAGERVRTQRLTIVR